MADGNAADGEKIFNKCKACHAVGEGAKNKLGPELNDVLGRTAGGLESFERKYSKPMKAAGADGLVWNEDSLKEFLTKPKDLIKGTKMSFAGLKKEQELEDIIAYLETFSPDYVAEEAAGD
jgi:S-disulfanyl-L-cysteine oxidoreductase SoxD